MRLPPPVPVTAGSDSSPPLPQPSPHQHMPQPAQRAHPHSILSPPPPFGTGSFYGASSPHHQTHQQLAASLSPRPVPGYSPPSYAFAQQQHDHDLSSRHFPAPPSTELAPLQLNAQGSSARNVLPSLASLAAPPGRLGPRGDTSHSPPPQPRVWPSPNPYSAYYEHQGQSADSPARNDLDSKGNATTGGPRSPENMFGGASSVSLDDPDVKMAAEALGDLKASKFAALVYTDDVDTALSFYKAPPIQHRGLTIIPPSQTRFSIPDTSDVEYIF